MLFFFFFSLPSATGGGVGVRLWDGAAVRGDVARRLHRQVQRSDSEFGSQTHESNKEQSPTAIYLPPLVTAGLKPALCKLVLIAIILNPCL